MTPEQIAEARRMAHDATDRADKASIGPWLPEDQDGVYIEVQAHDLRSEQMDIAEVWSGQANADFIAFARTDVPRLAAKLVEALDEIERLRAQPRMVQVEDDSEW